MPQAGTVPDAGQDCVDFDKDCLQDDYQQKLSLKREDVRLATFNNWPTNAPVSPEALAKDGFYYTKADDRAKCIFCNLILKSWDRGDNVQTEHLKFNPNCPFLLNKNVGNVPLVTAVQTTERCSEQLNIGPKHLEYSSLQSRKESFRCMPPTPMTQSTDMLAEAGFFWTGHGDSVRCFQCGGNLRNWEPEDDPWTEHQHWFPACLHVKSRPASRESFEVTPLIQQCLDMGYEKELVKNAVNKIRRKSGGDVDALNLLIDSVEKLRFQQETMSRAQESPGSPPVTPGFSAHSNIKQSSGASSLEDEYRELKDQRLCKICMENEVQITFIPCGHLVVCEKCSHKISVCPICRQRIRASVRTFMS